MKFSIMVEQVLDLLQRQKRISYRALKREFDLNDEYIADLREELIEARRVASDENGRVLVWIGEEPEIETGHRRKGESEKKLSRAFAPSSRNLDTAERRQLTVLFCDLVNYTKLSTQLDPEVLREVVNAYQETCTEVIRRYDGYIAQHLVDGLLVYFGYPTAHEDKAARALRTGLEIIQALQQLVSSSLVGEGQ
jgi:hypothetical protein